MAASPTCGAPGQRSKVGDLAYESMPDVADNFVQPTGFAPPPSTPRTRLGNRGTPTTQALITTVVLGGLALVWLFLLYAVFVGRWTPASTTGSRRWSGYVVTTVVLICFTVVVVAAARTRRRAIAAGATVSLMFILQRIIAAILASSYRIYHDLPSGEQSVEHHGLDLDPVAGYLLSVLSGFLFCFAVIAGWAISRRRHPVSWAGMTVAVPLFLVIEVFSAAAYTSVTLNSIPAGAYEHSPWYWASGIRWTFHTGWAQFVVDALLLMLFLTIALVSMWVFDAIGSATRRRTVAPAAWRGTGGHGAFDAPQPGPHSPAQPWSPEASRIDALKELGLLRERRVLTDAEFEAEKARILNEPNTRV